ncbi:PREDICTED: uncharacterized protein LOC109146739 [Ipomoea nil]|uniref:uncharacterized protein LOC109146739 n=1 Tax=Ipomoea nil TaxID=35883 RepID=UPI000901DE66|nr:PREDICTED: uncharacterized protein LOC109146739 [Ipomoea nil]
MLRSRERRQVYLLDYVEEYCLDTGFGELVVQQCLQIPVSLGVSLLEATGLYKGWRKISSKGDSASNLRARRFSILSHRLLTVLSSANGEMDQSALPAFLPRPILLLLLTILSATAVTALYGPSSPVLQLNPSNFKSKVLDSNGIVLVELVGQLIVECYLLKCFPVPYALFLNVVATVAAFIGQHIVRRLIVVLGRASLIIFILAFMAFTIDIPIIDYDLAVLIQPMLMLGISVGFKMIMAAGIIDPTKVVRCCLKRTARDVRRLTGRKFEDKEVQRDMKLVPYKIVNKDEQPYIQVKIKDGETKVSFSSILQATKDAGIITGLNSFVSKLGM